MRVITAPFQYSSKTIETSCLILFPLSKYWCDFALLFSGKPKGGKDHTMKTNERFRYLVRFTLCEVASFMGLSYLIGCTSFDVTGYDKGDDDGVRCSTYHGCLYDNHIWNGYLWEDDWVSCKSQTNTIKKVTVEQNFLYSFATVASLGLWAPVDISWQLNEPIGAAQQSLNTKDKEVE